MLGVGESDPIGRRFRDKFTVFIFRLRKPCDEKEEVLFKCAPPFSFRHILSLTSHTQSFQVKYWSSHLNVFLNFIGFLKLFFNFQREVESATVSGNLDSPEGGFDAIMQAVVCGNRIGREKILTSIISIFILLFHEYFLFPELQVGERWLESYLYSPQTPPFISLVMAR